MDNFVIVMHMLFYCDVLNKFPFLKNYVHSNKNQGTLLEKIRELIICYCFVSLFWNSLLKSAFARNSEFSK